MRFTWIPIVLLSVACGDSPTTPTPTGEVSSITLDALPTAPPPVAPRWPQPHPSGQWGREDPNFPPTGNQCPPTYRPHYNSWNWICVNPELGAEMPRRGGYPADWDWRKGDR